MNTAYSGSSRGVSSFGQLGILIALLGIGFILAGIVTVAAPIIALNIRFSEVPKALLDSKNIQLSRFVQFASTFFLFALPAFCMAAIVYGKPTQYLGLTAHSNARQFYIVLLLIITALFAQSTISQFNEWIPIPASWAQKFKQMEDEYGKEVLAMAQMKTFADYIYAMIILAFLPAMFEELFFRGALQQTLIRLFRSTFPGILLTSILFSAAHFSYYGFLTRLFLGLLLGYIFYYGKNIWLNITAHFLNNAIVVTSLYMLSRSGKLTEKSMDDDNYPIYVGLIAIVGVFALFTFFKRESMKTALVTHNGISEEVQITDSSDREENDIL